MSYWDGTRMGGRCAARSQAPQPRQARGCGNARGGPCHSPHVRPDRGLRVRRQGRSWRRQAGWRWQHHGRRHRSRWPHSSSTTTAMARRTTSDVVTFNISTTATTTPYVNLECCPERRARSLIGWKGYWGLARHELELRSELRGMARRRRRLHRIPEDADQAGAGRLSPPRASTSTGSQAAGLSSWHPIERPRRLPGLSSFGQTSLSVNRRQALVDRPLK